MSLATMLADRVACARIVALLYAFGLVIAFAEKLYRVRDYGDTGWFTWQILGFDREHLGWFRRWKRVARLLFGAHGMGLGFGLGIAGAITLAFAVPRTGPFTAGVAATLAGTLMCFARTNYGGDGAQQMNLIIGAALLLGFNPWVSAEVGTICVLSIAAHSCFAYFTSGVAKLVSPIWMRGDPLAAILATKAYGSPLGYRLVERAPRLRRPVGIAMVITEAAFPLALLGPWWVVLAFFAWGVLFHVANAVLMGLNSFLWAFIATYPAIAFAWTLLHH